MRGSTFGSIRRLSRWMRRGAWATLVVAALVMFSATGTASAAVPTPVDTGSLTSEKFDALGAAASAADFAPATLSASGKKSLLAAANKHKRVMGSATIVGGAPSIVTTSDGSLLVVWRLTGKKIEAQSVLLVAFDSQRNYVTTTQVTYTSDGRGGGTARQWIEGKLTAGLIVTAAQVAAVSPALEQSGLTRTICANAPDWVWIVAATLCTFACFSIAWIACFSCFAAVLPLVWGGPCQ